MNLKQIIRKVLKEEHTFKSRLEELIKKLGVMEAIKLLGSSKKLFDKLELDYNDIRVQEDIVKNYLYHNEFSDVIFLKVNRVSPNKTVIESYIEPDTAANHTSWFDSVVCNEINKVFPFKVEPVWEFEWKKDKKTKIFLETHIFEETESITESKEQTKIPTKARRLVDEYEGLFRYHFNKHSVSGRICWSRDEESAMENILYYTIENIYYAYFGDMDDNSEEWGVIFKFIENYLKEKFTDMVYKEYRDCKKY